eukprot:TRINITY_DN4005_c0_g2_i2.p1 TRINITY_DN4005_c0_g2~~TRINITY_DN4005_c0_g2_i2.p1  ORF type:complete len:211 (-),score=46.94 TRINITY_DN4005_c0_g2_i2:525-1157(-)
MASRSYDVPPVREVKVVLLGATGVGKTCIANRYATGTFPTTAPTIGASYMKKTISLPNQIFEIQMWDTAGQEKYRSLAPMYYRDSHAVLVAFDITDLASFDSARQWVKEFRISGPDSAVMILAANKCDRESERVVDIEMSKAYAVEIGATYIETSALTGKNIEEAFLQIAQEISKKTASGSAADSIRGKRLTSPSPSSASKTPESSGKCC